MKATAQLHWNLWVDCPHCEMTLDLSDPDYDCEGDFSTPIFSNKWHELQGLEVTCEHCDKVFYLEEVEY